MTRSQAQSAALSGRLSDRYQRELEAYALNLREPRTDDHPAFFPVFMAVGVLAIFLAAVTP